MAKLQSCDLQIEGRLGCIRNVLSLGGLEHVALASVEVLKLELRDAVAVPGPESDAGLAEHLAAIDPHYLLAVGGSCTTISFSGTTFLRRSRQLEAE